MSLFWTIVLIIYLFIKSTKKDLERMQEEKIENDKLKEKNNEEEK